MLTSSQQASLQLWYLVNMSVTSYAKLIAIFHTADQAIQASLTDWQALNLHASHLERFAEFIKQHRQSEFLLTTLRQLEQGDYRIVFYDDIAYPAALKQIFDPPPLLFYQGNLQALSMPQLAIVGSRKPSVHADKIAFDMAQFLAFEGLWITSGMAEGIDKQAHLGALAQQDPSKQGRTIAVLGNGIRHCYPKYHSQLKQQIIQTGGCVVSEFLPETPSNRHNFPRRNRLVAGLSLGTLVVEAALQSGSLITARYTNEQGKQVFAIPSHIDNVNAKGCHQLIREGATLIDHPVQILEDLSVFKSPFSQPTNNQPPKNMASPPSLEQSNQQTQNEPSQSHVHQNLSAQSLNTQSPLPQVNNGLSLDLPPHLLTLLNQLDWVGQDMDKLVTTTQLDVATLTGNLIELELMGLAMQQGGLYMRCRS